jgi:hypothetical protein
VSAAYLALFSGAPTEKEKAFWRMPPAMASPALRISSSLSSTPSNSCSSNNPLPHHEGSISRPRRAEPAPLPRSHRQFSSGCWTTAGNIRLSHAGRERHDGFAPATAKNVIYLYMGGGQSQFETWDPKEGVEARAPQRSSRRVPTASASRSTSPARQSRCIMQRIALPHVDPRRPRTGRLLHAHQLHFARHDPSSVDGSLAHTPAGRREPHPSEIRSSSATTASIRAPAFFPAAEGPFCVSNPENGIKNGAL